MFQKLQSSAPASRKFIPALNYFRTDKAKPVELTIGEENSNSMSLAAPPADVADYDVDHGQAGVVCLDDDLGPAPATRASRISSSGSRLTLMRR